MSRNAAIVLMLCVAVAVSSCRNRSKQPTDTVSSGVIKISADESFRPLIQQEIDVFEGLYPAAGIIPEYTRSDHPADQRQRATGRQYPQTDPARDQHAQ